MKKLASKNPGQTRLTAFFSKKSSNELVDSNAETKVPRNRAESIVDIGSITTVDLVENDQKENPASLKESSTTGSTRKHNSSPKMEKLLKLPLKEIATSSRALSPTKKASKEPLNGTPISLKKATPKKKKLSPLKGISLFDTPDGSPLNDPKNGQPKKALESIVSCEENTSNEKPKKRKFNGSPLKKQQNGLDLAIGSQPSSKANGSTFNKNVCNTSVEWGDETDFIDLYEDTIIVSPKKVLVKKRKFDENTSETTPPINTNNKLINTNLSSYFQKEVTIEDKGTLRFDKLERYEVVDVIQNGEEMKLTLRSLSLDVSGVCYVRSPWNESIISVKDIISVRAVKTEEGWVVDWKGLLVIDPDRLISGTTIVGSVYCMRKSVLKHLFKESGGAKDIMVIGSLVHEIFQDALKRRLNTISKIEESIKRKIKSREFMLALFLSNMNYEKTVSEIESFTGQIHNFMQQYIFCESSHTSAEKWGGQITEIEDIEENIWSPVLGIKGKIDATVEVKINKKTKVMPLELKTGKVSFSIEHRGQVILYCMLLQQLGRNVESGLLLYLNSGVHMQEIKCEERETRDLTLLRNGLCHWLSLLAVREGSGVIPPPRLPPPINRRTCSTCPLLVPCSAALSRDQGLEQLPLGHHLKGLAPDAIKHLTDAHIDFVFHWLGLLSLEKSSSSSKLSDIWTVNPDLREKSGKCLASLIMDDCVKDGDGGITATFSKMDGSLLETEFTPGQLLVVSTEGQVAHSLGSIRSMSPVSITLTLDRFFKTSRPVFLDSYEGDSTFTILTNNLSCLFEDSPRAATLRELIIDKKLPTFAPKISSKIKKIGSDIFQRLNKEQLRAVLQTISSENYILIKGMPGTGKTTTMAALIELLTRMKKRVLVTSFTHSAIDNILINLVGKVKVLRLGPEHRIHPKLREVSEHYYVKNLEEVTPGGIEAIFSTTEVVGVTCFGCKHPWIERQVFDICLVDEASQTALPAVLKPISIAEKFVLIGDPQQLPPLVLNEEAKKFGLGKSLFDWLERRPVTSVLTQQYRMNEIINKLANDLTYGGQLQCANDTVARATLILPKRSDECQPIWLKEALSPELMKSVIILDIKGDTTSDVGENKTEAAIVMKIAAALIKGGVEEESIGVIATYSRQVTLIKSLINFNVEVNTVDQYQGRDKEVIIYSTTRSVVSSKKNDILSDWNRLTVAITRAKKKLIILGDIDVLKYYDNFSKLISAVSKDNVVKVQLDKTV